MDAFISYSHHNTSALERLHVHLAVLRRDGLIREWFDRDILAGDDLDGRIADKLESSSLFLLIITPDFLNSDYCVEREMARALERQKAGEARVVGVIVEPCDWQSTPLRAIKALPRDGKPVAEWTNANSAWLNVVQEIRRAIQQDRQVGSAAQARDAASPSVSRPPATASRYRAKRDFDDIDRSEFRERAFEEIKGYFREASSELNSLGDFRARVVDISPTAFGCTIVNRPEPRHRPSDGPSPNQQKLRNGRYLLVVRGEFGFRYSQRLAFDRKRRVRTLLEGAVLQLWLGRASEDELAGSRFLNVERHAPKGWYRT